jgi:hypothetical protein
MTLQKQFEQNFGFLELFYSVLFKPKQARLLINHLKSEDSTKLFGYAVLCLALGALGIASYEGTFLTVFNSVITWLFTVLLIGLLAWVLRPKAEEFDFASIFFFCAFAQAPLAFLGLASLWKNSIFPTTVPSAICFLWSIMLWIWAISNSLQVGSLRAAVLVISAFLLPIIAILFLAVLLIGAVFAQLT